MFTINDNRLHYIAMLANIKSEVEWLCHQNNTTFEEVCLKVNCSPYIELMSFEQLSNIVYSMNGTINIKVEHDVEAI